MSGNLQELASAVMDEILDPEFDTFTHGNKGTSYRGCKGPLCRKAERDSCAARYRKRVGRDVKEYAPRESAYPEEWLQEIIDWHRAERKKIGISRSLLEYYKINPVDTRILVSAR